MVSSVHQPVPIPQNGSPETPDEIATAASEEDSEASATGTDLHAAFLRRFELGTALRSALPWRPLWIGLVSDPISARRFEALRRRWKGFTLVAPLGTEARLDADTEHAVVRYPERYVKHLHRHLHRRLGSIAGILLADDCQPWLRHFVYACKEQRLRTVLWPNRSFSEGDIFRSPKAANAEELLSSRPWAVSSAYGGGGLTPDCPATDFVLAENAIERRFFDSLGYPAERVLDLSGGNSDHENRRALEPQSDDLAHVERILRDLSPRFAALRWPRPQPYVPGDPEPLFSAEIQSTPRAGIVAYHRPIDATALYVPAMLGFRRMTSPTSIEEAQTADIFAYWGGLQGESRKLRLNRWARRLKRPLLLLEDGLFRSVEIGLSGTPALSIMLDDRGAYYDATIPNRLEGLLASRHEFTDEERARARTCIDRISELRLSKYNHAPDRPLDYPRDSVLLVDQRRGDLSVTKGLADETSFRDLVLSACRENPDRTILVKRHPDAMSGGKQSYFSSESLAEWGSFPNLVLVDYETNPHALFDCCSKAYVVTSGMGFEALLRGLEVHCFGMPFYAGWGITKDRRTCPRRTRRRTVEEVFFAACILHSRYFDPTRLAPCTLEEAIEALARARDEKLARTNRT